MSAFHLCTKHLPRLVALALAVPLSLPLPAVHAQNLGASQQAVVPCGRALLVGEWGCFGTMEMRIDGKAYRLTQGPVGQAGRHHRLEPVDDAGRLPT